MPPPVRARFLESLNPSEAEYLARDWPFWARIEQLPPKGDWRIWLFLGGRGAGKTLSGAEWILSGVREGRMRRVALVGATYADVRDVMIQGESGLLAAGAGDGVRYLPSKRQLHWPGGAMAQAFTAEEPDGLRGHQFDGGWIDGKKTYVIAVLAATTAAAQALGYAIPDWVYALEGALGLGALRVAVSKS